MGRAWTVTGMLALALSLGMRPQGVAEAQIPPRCPAVTVALDPAALPWSPWQTAVRSLRAVLAETGHAWSCSGARVVVSGVPGAGRVEVLMPDGRGAARRVAVPEELVPAVEALLVADPQPWSPAATLPPTVIPTAPVDTPPMPRGIDSAPTTSVVLPRTVPESPHGGVRLVGGIDLGLRLVGPETTAMFSMRVLGEVCLSQWCFGVWGRYELLVAILDSGATDFDLEALGGGLTATWAAPVGAGRIELGPSVGVVNVVESSGEVDSARANTVVQPRLGTLVRWTSSRHGPAVTATLDAEATLGSLLRTGMGFDPRLPTAPAWSVALSIGAAWDQGP